MEHMLKVRWLPENDAPKPKGTPGPSNGAGATVGVGADPDLVRKEELHGETETNMQMARMERKRETRRHRDASCGGLRESSSQLGDGVSRYFT